jgi:hypothetical protein
MTDPQIVGNPPNQKSLYDVWYAVSSLTDAWDSTNHNLQVTSDNDIWVNNLTVPAGRTMSLASGQEFTCGALDNSGTIVNMGYLRCTSFTTEAGSTYISGPGSVKEVFAGY